MRIKSINDRCDIKSDDTIILREKKKTKIEYLTQFLALISFEIYYLGNFFAALHPKVRCELKYLSRCLEQFVSI